MNKNFKVRGLDFYNSQVIDSVLKLLNITFKTQSYTKEYWHWKYQMNPFGDSVGWIAVDNKTKNVIGVRILWKWLMQYNKKLVNCYQAVDTATHPLYQRKGVFSALIKEAIDYITINKFLIFNFPNRNSLPGYLKFGWIKLAGVSTLYKPINKLKYPQIILNKVFQPASKILDCSFRIKKFNFFFPNEKYKLSTYWGKDAINWRFVLHPFNKYYCFENNSGIFIYVLRNRKKLPEVQIILSYIRDYNFIKDFIRFLSHLNIAFISYNGLNSKLNLYLEKNHLSFHISKVQIAYTARLGNSNVEESNLKLELGEADWI